MYGIISRCDCSSFLRFIPSLTVAASAIARIWLVKELKGIETEIDEHAKRVMV